MAQFFFHVRDERGLIADEEGGDYRGLADAMEEARASARDLAKQYVDAKNMPVDAWIDVADESGAVVAAFPLRDVLRRDANTAERAYDAHLRADKMLEVARRVHQAISNGLVQERRELDSRAAAEDLRWRDEERVLTEAARSMNDR
jgi:hypothetical protein